MTLQVERYAKLEAVSEPEALPDGRLARDGTPLLLARERILELHPDFLSEFERR